MNRVSRCGTKAEPLWNHFTSKVVPNPYGPLGPRGGTSWGNQITENLMRCAPKNQETP